MFFDSHCHLEDERFDEDRDAIFREMAEGGFDPCLICGSGLASMRKAAAIAAMYPRTYYAVGVHPHEATTWNADAALETQTAFQDPKCVAWGEIGLDFYYDYSPRTVQIAAFEEQLDSAYILHKPVILHVRDAHGQTTDILRARLNRLPQGVMHCYSGSVEQAKVYLDMGFYISLAGPVTFKNAKNLHAVAQMVPLDRLMVETDSPYLTPTPLRGQRNTPMNVRYVVEAIATLRTESVENIARETRANALSLFQIPEET